jgi:hypothetical protein
MVEIFAKLNVLALTTTICGPGTSDRHAVLRLSPIICLDELIQHCTYAVHVLAGNPGFDFRIDIVGDAGGALLAARICGLLLSFGFAGQFTMSPQYLPWSIFWSWIHILRSLSLLLLPS